MSNGTTELVILGLDGATFDVIGPMVARGDLPTFSRLAEDGASGRLLSSPVPVSPCAWTCMTTGKNPAKHGIYDFCRRKPGTYQIEVVNASFVRSKHLWDLVGEAGKRCAVVNVPVTFPPRRVNGILVSGLLTPSVRSRFTWPDSLRDELLDAVPAYRIATSEVFDPKRPERFAADVREVLQAREQAVRHLHQAHGADFEMHVFMALDHIQHKLWREPGAEADPSGAPSRAVLDMYREMDGCLGRLLDAFGEETTFLVVSDHGFGPLDKVLRINRWLMRERWLALKPSWHLAVRKRIARTDLVARTYRLMQRCGLGSLARFVPKKAQHLAATSGISFDDVDWSHTKAYSYGEFGQIYVNLKGREPQGFVERGEEYDELLQTITERLKALRDPDSGAPIVTRVCRKEELYHGDLLDQAPDLTFAIGDFRYDASVAFGFEREDVIGQAEFFDTGSHRPEGILFARGPAIRSGVTITGASVYDVAPTALHLMDLPVPEDMDGNVLTDMLTVSRPVSYAAASAETATETSEMSDEDRRAIEERLRALGYMD